MNYLAHLYLADDHPDAVVGALAGDFIKGAIPLDLPPRMRHAVLQHRRIDSFTDSHPLVLRSKRRISPRFRRYAGILVDMFYDHFLACNWATYEARPLEDYAAMVYDIVADHPAPSPGRMSAAMGFMIEHNTLVRYRETQGIALALRGIETRLRRPSQLGEAIDELHHNYAELEQDFAGFFAALIQFVALDEEIS